MTIFKSKKKTVLNERINSVYNITVYNGVLRSFHEVIHEVFHEVFHEAIHNVFHEVFHEVFYEVFYEVFSAFYSRIKPV